MWPVGITGQPSLVVVRVCTKKLVPECGPGMCNQPRRTFVVEEVKGNEHLFC